MDSQSAQQFVKDRAWPDSFDLTLLTVFLALVVLVPLVGYVFMFVDIRAYLRSLRRQLMRVVALGQEAPWWAYRENHSCLTAFGLALPCTEEELKRAYRERVKELHPDRGGDKRRFLRLQSQFEQAMRLLSDSPQPVAAASQAAERPAPKSSAVSD